LQLQGSGTKPTTGRQGIDAWICPKLCNFRYGVGIGVASVPGGAAQIGGHRSWGGDAEVLRGSDRFLQDDSVRGGFFQCD